MALNRPRTESPGAGYQLPVWLDRHLRVALQSADRLLHQPLASLMTAMVIGIALSLPAGLFVMLSNLQQLSGSWDDAASISAFLRPDVTDEAASELARNLRADSRIAEVKVLGKQAALDEFRQFSGFGQALEALDENPLPALLVIQPTLSDSEPAKAETLTRLLGELPEVDFAQLDLQWVRRFHALTEIAQRAVMVVGAILGLAVLLIVGNTVRLEIQNRRQEVEVSKLVGATNAFIRRPFLYSGLWYGLTGGLIACLLIVLALWLLSAPVERLAGLYQRQFGLLWLSPFTALAILVVGALLGLVGAWVSVSRHLAAIEPT